MDQAKWALPRDRVAMQAKEAQGLSRPRIKVHAVWNHGISLTLFLVHPQASGDSSLVVECFNRVLQDAAELFAEKGRPMPDTCLAWEPWLHRVAEVGAL